MENENYSEEVLNTQNEPTLIIDENIRSFLTETIKWGRLLAIIGFVMAGLIVMGGISFMFFGSFFTSQMPAGMAMGGFIGVIYVLMGLLYYFPAKYLYDFNIHIKRALQSNDQEPLVEGFSKMKSFFKFWGVMMIVMIIIYAVAILIGAIVMIFAVAIR